MSTIVLGCDTNSNDKKFQSDVAKVLEKAGHTVEKLTIGPNYFAKYSYGNEGKNPKGKIGIYLIAAGTYSIADFYYGAASNNKSFKYAYFGIRGDLSVRPHNQSEFESAKIGADADCPASLCAHIKGMTFPAMNKKLKDKCQIVFGKTGKEMGEALVKAMGGETSASDSKKESSSSSSAKECIQKLLKHWDGEVECRIIDDKVYINKIRDPQSNYHLVLQEGLNVFSDSISISDVNPNTVNYLVVHWSEGKITIKDDTLIKRFGKIRLDVNAVKKIKKKVTKSKKNNSSDDSNSDDSSDDSSNDDEDNTKTTIVEVPITKYKEALSFANTEWNKIKRDNGHSIDCQVAGSNKWRTGEWVKVILPSFDENCFMYIIRASHSDDGGDWTCNLSLVDYPPGWGVEEVEDSSSDDSSSRDDSSSDDS